jgi:tRNA pseudouridine55 synthase
MNKNWIGSVWKPKGISSFKVLGDVKKYFGTKKVGHMGTLDPLASGVLPVAVGKYTKLIQYVNLLPKEYEAEITFGVSSDTLDAEGVMESNLDKVRGLDVEFGLGEVEKVLEGMVGEVQQVPPRFSALKIDGKRAYELARGDEEFEMKSRQVECFGLKVVDFEEVDGLWKLSLRVSCGKGYYVRSLVRDVCAELGVEGYMSELVRLRVGGFTESNSVRFGDDEIDLMVDWSEVLKGCEFLELSKFEVDEFRNGRSVDCSLDHFGVVIGFYEGEPVSILEVVEDGGNMILKVKKNI